MLPVRDHPSISLISKHPIQPGTNLAALMRKIMRSIRLIGSDPNDLTATIQRNCPCSTATPSPTASEPRSC